MDEAAARARGGPSVWSFLVPALLAFASMLSLWWIEKVSEKQEALSAEIANFRVESTREFLSRSDFMAATELRGREHQDMFRMLQDLKAQIGGVSSHLEMMDRDDDNRLRAK